MGRWSTTIMGGDAPLDMEADIYDHLEIEMFPEDEDNNEKSELPKAMLEEKQHELLKEFGVDEEFPMVLAVIMMRFGAAIHKDVKKAAISAAKNDDWSRENEERKRHTKNFIATLKAYDNVTPTDIEEEGLFDKIFKTI